MDIEIEKVKNQIKALLKIAKITQTEKEEILDLLADFSVDELLEMRFNLIQQVSTDIYTSFLDDLEKDDRILDEDALKEFDQQLTKRFQDTEAVILTEAEIHQIRQDLQNIQQ